MANAKEGDKNGNELYYMYVVLGRLQNLLPMAIGRLSVNQSIFPKRFVYKLINDRLIESRELAQNLATALFRRLSGSESFTEQNREQLVDASARQRVVESYHYSTSDAGSIELDEYFHCTLCNLHDFLINLNWHEPILEDAPTKSDNKYIKSRLPQLEELIEFRKLLVAKNVLKMTMSTKGSGAKSAIVSTLDAAGSKVIRSSLARRSPESPGPRRRVRFSDIQSTTTTKELAPQDDQRYKRYLRDSHSILALDLILFALHAFIDELKGQLLKWSTESTVAIKESMQLIRTSTRKLRVNRLISMAKDREVSNAVYAGIMNNLAEMENTYLLEHILVTVCAQDEERLLRIHKRPHVRTFVNEFIRCAEKELLNMMADQILEILFELAICEINMHPIELTGRGKSVKPKEGVEMSKAGQANYLSFVTSWLNLDKILFGSQVQPVKTAVAAQPAGQQAKQQNAEFEFKSSSRLLNQMDNLQELMRHILADLVNQIDSKRHLEYFLSLLHKGMAQCLDTIARQMDSQFYLLRKSLQVQRRQALRDAVDMDQSSNFDRIMIKIRYLKLIHISSSMDNLIKELSQLVAVNVTSTSDSELSSGKISRLIEDSTHQMELI